MVRFLRRARAARRVFAVLGSLPLVAGGCENAPADLPRPSVEEASPAAPGTSEVAGRLERRPGGATPIVTLEPHAPLDVPLPAEPAEMDQYGRTFIPRLLVVRAGQTVRFKNSENELHNVNVTDERGVTIFNVGMPILGGTFDHRFDRAGDYAVRCNVHQEMAATISVTSSPFAAVADREGRFALSGVPYGAYDLVVRRGAEREARVVDVAAPRTEIVERESAP